MLEQSLIDVMLSSLNKTTTSVISVTRTGNGGLQIVRTAWVNLLFKNVSGVDFVINYLFDVENHGLFTEGVLWTWLLHQR